MTTQHLDLNLTSTRTLSDGRKMPRFGLGVWKSQGGEEIDAVRWALEAGYRHIDTAAIYENEEGVGEGMRASSVPREDIWLTTKLWNDKIRGGEARRGLEESLSRLKTDYVDLYLLHWPVEGRIEAWKELIKLREEGLCKSIGVSNFMIEHLDELAAASDVRPVVNQIELHPIHQQADVQAKCDELGIAVEGWSPLIQGKFKSMPEFEEFGRRHEKTAAQVVLRWALQRGFITIPKSSNEGRIKENAALFDFALSDEEMSAIDAMDRGECFIDPRNISF